MPYVSSTPYEGLPWHMDNDNLLTTMEEQEGFEPRCTVIAQEVTYEKHVVQW